MLPAVPVRSGGSSGSPDARALSCAISCLCDSAMPLGGRTHRPHPLTILLYDSAAGCRAHCHRGHCAVVTSRCKNILRPSVSVTLQPAWYCQAQAGSHRHSGTMHWTGTC